MIRRTFAMRRRAAEKRRRVAVEVNTLRFRMKCAMLILEEEIHCPMSHKMWWQILEVDNPDAATRESYYQGIRIAGQSLREIAAIRAGAGSCDVENSKEWN